MTAKQEPEILNIFTLLTEGEYIIPLYQRAYSWCQPEIEQLLNDVFEKFRTEPSSGYYIGSLIVAKDKNGSFQIIDGQQRHTTLTLIHIVVNHLFETNASSGTKINLRYEGRSASELMIAEYAADYNLANTVDDRHEKLSSINVALKVVKRFFELKLKYNDLATMTAFINYLFRQVFIIRIPLPPTTNLNQYFEIMNNRGEQLEAHEILKAKFLETLKGKDDTVREQFAVAWDACSQMDKYIQACFPVHLRTGVFGDDLLAIPQHYLQNTTGSSQLFFSDDTEDELQHILSRTSSGNLDKTETPVVSKFRSIINFPNFLLQTLRLHLSDNDVSLDDKKLLQEFGCTYKSTRELPDAIAFINDLLYYRTCFDRYIIKREEAQDGTSWKILRFKEIDSNYVNVFDQPQNVIMIQAMLEVSFSSNNFKNWLQNILALFKTSSVKDAETFYSELQNIAEILFRQTHKNLNNGTGTPIYLFNYLDFRLWQIYKAINSPSIYVSETVLRQIENKSAIFRTFRFRQGNSVEHIAPQRPDNDHDAHVANLNHFGNLCLISRSSNSKYSNSVFDGKKTYFKSDEEHNRVESLKQALIFSNSQWGDKEIIDHGADMASILYKEKIMRSLDDLIQYLVSMYPQEFSPDPRYLFRGERTVYWPSSMTTYSRNLDKKPFIEDVNYLLFGFNRFVDFQYQSHSLYLFLREAIYDIGVVSPEQYEAEIDLFIAGIFQHYGFDTSLLDLTDDIQIAANFAAFGKVGDVGQIMVIESNKIEGHYYNLKSQPGNRASRQNAYGLLGTTQLDLKSDEFQNKYQPKWFKFILTESDKEKYTNSEMLAVENDSVIPLILDWWDTIGKQDQKAATEAKNYLEQKIAVLRN